MTVRGGGRVITFTPWLLLPRGKGCMCLLVRKLYGSQGWSGHILVQITLCPLLRILTTLFVERLDHSLFIISAKRRVLWKTWREGIIWEFKTITTGNRLKSRYKNMNGWIGFMWLGTHFTECMSWSFRLSECKHTHSVPLRPCSWLHPSDVTVSADRVKNEKLLRSVK